MTVRQLSVHFKIHRGTAACDMPRPVWWKVTLVRAPAEFGGLATLRCIHIAERDTQVGGERNVATFPRLDADVEVESTLPPAQGNERGAAHVDRQVQHETAAADARFELAADIGCVEGYPFARYAVGLPAAPSLSAQRIWNCPSRMSMWRSSSGSTPWPIQPNPTITRCPSKRCILPSVFYVRLLARILLFVAP